MGANFFINHKSDLIEYISIKNGRNGLLLSE